MKILENENALLTDFIQLNEGWIMHHFQLEEADLELAKNPKKVIEDGGYIYSLVINNEVAGVCALFNDSDGVYELARMAVLPKYQSNGYGALLIEKCLSTLREINAVKVYLVSNTKLKAAISLYKKYGFQVVSEGQHPVYSRANIMMERNAL